MPAKGAAVGGVSWRRVVYVRVTSWCMRMFCMNRGLPLVVLDTSKYYYLFIYFLNYLKTKTHHVVRFPMSVGLQKMNLKTGMHDDAAASTRGLFSYTHGLRATTYSALCDMAPLPPEAAYTAAAAIAPSVLCLSECCRIRMNCCDLSAKKIFLSLSHHACFYPTPRHGCIPVAWGGKEQQRACD